MEPLIIERVRLRNFLSHADSVVEFTKGVNVLIGPNGAGKSSILEAIYYALTGKGWRTPRSSQVSLLRREGAQTAEVMLEFVMDGKKYVVHRFIGSNRQDIVRVDGKVVAQGKQAVSDFIRSALGLTGDQIDKIVLIPQGGITRLFTQLRPAERKEAIDKLLGLHAYQEVGEIIKETPITANIGGVPKTFRPRRTELLREARVLAESLKERQAMVREQIEALHKEFTEVKQRLEQVRERVAELEAVVAKQEELEEAFSRAKAEKEAVEARLKDIEEEISRLRDTIKEADEELELLEKEEAALSSKARLAGLRGDVDELGRVLERESGLVETIKATREYLEELEKNLRRIRELESEVGSGPEELRERLRRAEAVAEGLLEERTSLMTKIGRVKERSISLKEFIESIEKELSKVGEDVARVTGERPAPENLPAVIQETLNGLAEEGREVEEEIRRLTERIGGLRSGIEENVRKLALIEKAETPRCPLCGSPLTQEHRERIVRELKEGILSMRKELEESEKRLEELFKERERIRETASVITPDLLEKVKELIKRYSDAGKELETLKEEESLLTQKLTRVEAELKKANEEVDNLRNALRKAELLEELRKGFSIEDYERVRKTLQESEEELAGLRERVRELVKSLSATAGIKETDPRSLYERLREAVSETEEVVRKLAEVRARAEEVRGRKELALKNLREREEAAEELRQRHRQLSEKLEALQKELEEVRKAREELDRLRGEEAALKERLASLESKHDTLSQELEKLREDLEEARKAFRIAFVASWMAENVYSRDGLPKKMRPKILRILENYIEKLADRFNLGFQDVSINEDYEISLVPVNNPRVRRLITSLSGGEQVSLSMAALLAMFYVVSGSKIGFMALDEPTEYLDEDRQRALVDMFRRFQGGKILPQLIIVTHDESIKEVADRIYQVEKVDGVSRVTLVEPGEWV